MRTKDDIDAGGSRGAAAAFDGQEGIFKAHAPACLPDDRRQAIEMHASALIDMGPKHDQQRLRLRRDSTEVLIERGAARIMELAAGKQYALQAN